MTKIQSSEFAASTPHQKWMPIFTGKAISFLSRWLQQVTRAPTSLYEVAEPIGMVVQSKPSAVLLYFNDWKKEFIADFFPEYNVFYFKPTHYQKRILHWLITQDCELIIWGYKDQIKHRGIFDSHPRLQRVEDGFLRSAQLGAHRVKPLSLAVDKRGLYYDSTRTSDLECLLNQYEFTPQQIAEAAKIIEQIKQHGVSKYNHAPQKCLSDLIGPKTRERILVIGQVEKDCSIQYGCNKPFLNNDLVKLAHQENPQAEIIYKIHPDILAKKRKQISPLKYVEKICTILAQDIAPCSLFAGVDKVYTITSLMGFEALFYGLPVICVGAPFYSGWGLTEDRQPIARRIRHRSLEEVFYAAYIFYLRYPYGDIMSVIEQLRSEG
jgi:capsular polysaccharide export protein